MCSQTWPARARSTAACLSARPGRGARPARGLPGLPAPPHGPQLARSCTCWCWRPPSASAAARRSLHLQCTRLQARAAQAGRSGGAPDRPPCRPGHTRRPRWRTRPRRCPAGVARLRHRMIDARPAHGRRSALAHHELVKLGVVLAGGGLVVGLLLGSRLRGLGVRLGRRDALPHTPRRVSVSVPRAKSTDCSRRARPAASTGRQRTPMPDGISGACRAGPISERVVKPARDARSPASRARAARSAASAGRETAFRTCGATAQAWHIVGRPRQRIEVYSLPRCRRRRLLCQRRHLAEQAALRWSL